MTKKLRAFIAITLPQQVLLAADTIQKKLASNGIRLKWVRPGNMHLTLRFLGDIEEAQIPQIVTAIGSAAKEVTPFSLNAKRVGVFPNFRLPRVVWMGIEGELNPLMHIYQRLEKELTLLGFPHERRPFTGHLTLGRVSDRIIAQLLLDAISTAGPIESGMFTVDRICFIKSGLRPTGAVYTQLAEIFLTKNQEAAVNTIYRNFHQEES